MTIFNDILLSFSIKISLRPYPFRKEELVLFFSRKKSAPHRGPINFDILSYRFGQFDSIIVNSLEKLFEVQVFAAVIIVNSECPVEVL